MHCPDRGLDQFEEISYLLKNKDYISMEKFLRIDENELYNTQNQNYSAQVEKFTNIAKKFFEVTLSLSV
jgi:hypothetical protein